mmetsp:Transcript_20251/g.71587  ORF Transcript_20251/g.71587 Transcript_20251/m.71587 type:complete len:230 (+) Transcript_20251:994-1683(+)
MRLRFDVCQRSLAASSWASSDATDAAAAAAAAAAGSTSTRASTMTNRYSGKASAFSSEMLTSSTRQSFTVTGCNENARARTSISISVVPSQSSHTGSASPLAASRRASLAAVTASSTDMNCRRLARAPPPSPLAAFVPTKVNRAPPPARSTPANKAPPWLLDALPSAAAAAPAPPRLRFRNPEPSAAIMIDPPPSPSRARDAVEAPPRAASEPRTRTPVAPESAPATSS